jgi:hypothetical protein
LLEAREVSDDGNLSVSTIICILEWELLHRRLKHSSIQSAQLQGMNKSMPTIPEQTQLQQHGLMNIRLYGMVQCSRWLHVDVGEAIDGYS